MDIALLTFIFHMFKTNTYVIGYECEKDVTQNADKYGMFTRFRMYRNISDMLVKEIKLMARIA